MNMFVLLGVVVLVVLVAALTRAKPDGTRPVSNTRLMSGARIALIVLAVLILALALWGGLG